MSNSPCSRCRLHGCTTSKVQENRHHTTQLLETWLLCNLCIPVACDKLCQHITLVRRFFMHNSSRRLHSTWTFSNPFEVNSPLRDKQLRSLRLRCGFMIVCVVCVGGSHLSETLWLYSTEAPERFTSDNPPCRKKAS